MLNYKMPDDGMAFLLAEDLFWWSLVTVSTLGYMGYYLREVVKVNRACLRHTLPSSISIEHQIRNYAIVQRPIVAVADGPFSQFLRQHVPTLSMKFWPTFWCVESRAQTILGSLIRSKILPDVTYDRYVDVYALSTVRS